MKMGAMVLALALAGCNHAAKNAERDYRVVEISGSRSEMCVAAARAEIAWLEAGADQKHQDWQRTRMMECFRADIGH